MRERVNERWADPGQIFRPSEKTFREAHIRAVQDIAAQYFEYPNAEFPHLRTFVNEPEVGQRIFTNFGRELVPDIVVLEWPEKIPLIVAEVVTDDLLNEKTAREKWLPESRLVGVQLYLYVPAGSASDAKKLLKKAGIKNVSLRTWRNITGLRTVDIARIR